MQENTSTWKLNEPKPHFSPLNKNIDSDITIIGGGLAGIMTSYLLSKTGKKITLIDSAKIGSGATEYTTAFLMQDIDTDLSQLLKIFGKDKAALIWKSHEEAINKIEEIIAKEKIDCEFMSCPGYIYANDKKEAEDLNAEMEAAAECGFKMVKVTDLKFQQSGAARLDNQGKFHPLKFLYALSEKARDNGVQIYEDTEALEIINDQGRITIKTHQGEIKTNQVIVATYDPFNYPKQLMFKKGTYVSYVFEVLLPPNTLEEALYLDLYNPYRYFRIDKATAGQRMILGGEDHRHEIKMDPEKNYTALEEYLKTILPGVEYKINKRWTGPILEPSDGLALIGEYKKNEYVATAFSGNGMTYSAIAAMLLTDLINKKPNPWTELYDPKRIPGIKQIYEKAKDYTGELLGGAAKNLFDKTND